MIQYGLQVSTEIVWTGIGDEGLKRAKRISVGNLPIVWRFMGDWQSLDEQEPDRVEVVARELWKAHAEAEEDWGDEPATDEQWESLTIDSEKQAWRDRALVIMERLRWHV